MGGGTPALWKSPPPPLPPPPSLPPSLNAPAPRPAMARRTGPCRVLLPSVQLRFHCPRRAISAGLGGFEMGRAGAVRWGALASPPLLCLCRTRRECPQAMHRACTRSSASRSQHHCESPPPTTTGPMDCPCGAWGCLGARGVGPLSAPAPYLLGGGGGSIRRSQSAPHMPFPVCTCSDGRRFHFNRLEPLNCCATHTQPFAGGPSLPMGAVCCRPLRDLHGTTQGGRSPGP